MTTLHFSHALLPGGWARDVSVEVEAGLVTAVRTGCERAQRARTGLVALPGLANLHSHAFQRAMAGLGERRGAGRDSFWSWREHMFRLVERLGPDELEAIAALAFAEMLEGGFTAVVEFHYLHHAPDGRPYADRAEMARRVVAAAADTGIGLTLAPVLYTRAGFDDAAPGPAQRRFANDVEELVAIARDAHVALEALPHAQPALAAHSLRTVDPRSLDLLARVLPSAPLHVHAAEQVREVEQCRAALRQKIHQTKCGTFTIIVDVGFVGEPDEEEAAASSRISNSKSPSSNARSPPMKDPISSARQRFVE